MTFPQIDAANRRKPICFDPLRRKFILFDEVVSRREAIVPVDGLSPEDFRLLVIERQAAGPDYRVQAMSGPAMSRDDVIAAIRRDEPFGRMTVEAEKSCLRDLLAELQAALDEAS